MNKEQKVNYIKFWLQRFANRNNEGFTTKVRIGDTEWDLFMQFDYNDGGERFEPMDWCTKNFKHVHDNSIDDRTEEELDAIIEQLKLKFNGKQKTML